MQVIPLALTSVNWSDFIKICQTAIDDSPTRGLDKINMPIDSPASYLACMDMQNDPDTCLSNPNNVFNHFSVSFLTVGDEWLINLLSNTSLKLLTRETKRSYLIIVTGTMMQWYDEMLIDHLDIEMRQFLNACFNRFNEMGFKRIWGNCKKINYQDGTFRMVMK